MLDYYYYYAAIKNKAYLSPTIFHLPHVSEDLK